MNNSKSNNNSINKILESHQKNGQKINLFSRRRSTCASGENLRLFKVAPSSAYKFKMKKVEIFESSIIP